MINIKEIKTKIYFKQKSNKCYSQYATHFKKGDFIHNKKGELIYITNIRELAKTIEFTGIGEHGMAETFKRNKQTICTFK